MTLKTAQELLLKYKEHLSNKDITEEEYLDLVKSISVSKEITNTIEEIELKNNINKIIKYAISGVCLFL